MSYHGDYLAERGVNIIENKYGFVTYMEQKDHIGNDVVYICDIFVAKEYRQKSVGSKLADEVAIIAKEKGIKFLLGSTNLSRPGIELSFKSLMGYGMKVHSYHEEMIFWIKEIE